MIKPKFFLKMLAIAIVPAILGGCVHGLWRYSKQLESELEVAGLEIQSRGSIIKSSEEVNQELASTLASTIDDMKLLLTFQEAGFELDAGSVRSLLDLTKTLPYGIPFSGGHRVTSEFGMRSIRRYGWVDLDHLGVDLVTLDGDWTVNIPVDGFITDWGWSDLYGNYVEITTESGYRIFMAHLSHIYFPHVDEAGNWSIDPNQVVKQGQRIAVAGQTGQYATGTHLHYEIWIEVDGNYVPLDPSEILKYTGGTDVE